MKTWVSSKVMSVEEAYQQEIATYAENGTLIDKNEAYLKAAGAMSKSGVYRVGDQKMVYCGSSSSSVRSGCSSGRSLVSEVDQLRQALQVEKREREAIQRQMAQWQVLFQQMMMNMSTEFANQDAEGNETAHHASDSFSK